MPKINVYVPDDLAEAVRGHAIQVSAVCQAALRKEVHRMTMIENAEMIVVEIEDANEVRRDVEFRGHWLLEPEVDETRANDFTDAGAYWGVALTGRGRIAVYIAHCNDAWGPRLMDYDTLDDAHNDSIPADIIARAAEALGDTTPVHREVLDI
jgi:hypothetical protein